MKISELVKRCDDLNKLGQEALSATNQLEPPKNTIELYRNFKTSCQSFILLLYDKTHPYYENIQKITGSQWFIIKNYIGILEAIKTELEGGWLTTIKGIISAEIFSDFLEMAEHLLKEKYKDAAAVMIGGVLEEHLKQLSIKNEIQIELIKDNKTIPKKADQINVDLCKADVYNKLDQKSVTGWLDLRNKAAHGKYSEYSQDQVELMLKAVLDFVSRNSI